MKHVLTPEQWPLKTPFIIARERMDTLPLIHLALESGGVTGEAEAAGVDYRGETPATMAAEIADFLAALPAPCDRMALQDALPAGGARNAIDCALWDFECRRDGRSVFDRIGVTPRPLTTVMTLGIGTPGAMARAAAALPPGQPLKLKLGAGDGLDAARVERVRAAAPGATILVDVNEGWSFQELCELLPLLDRCGIALVEQPLSRDEDWQLDGLSSPVPLCADESFDTLDDLDRCAGRYRFVNIKLDKCGGLTHALAIVAAARARGVALMVGSMLGTALGMAPAFVVGQFCRFADLDGPLLLARDRAVTLDYALPQVRWPLDGFWADPK